MIPSDNGWSQLWLHVHNDAIQILALQGSNGPLKNCAACPGRSMGGGNPHLSEDAFPPNGLLFVALPFSLMLPAVAFVSYKKKLWKRVDFSGLKSSFTRKQTAAG